MCALLDGLDGRNTWRLTHETKLIHWVGERIARFGIAQTVLAFDWCCCEEGCVRVNEDIAELATRVGRCSAADCVIGLAPEEPENEPTGDV